jgi:hypothetical protein
MTSFDVAQSDRVETFATLHESGTFIVPNPWDADTARPFAGLGFPAQATTSGGLAFAVGRADGGNLVTRDEILANVQAITAATAPRYRLTWRVVSARRRAMSPRPSGWPRRPARSAGPDHAAVAATGCRLSGKASAPGCSEIPNVSIAFTCDSHGGASSAPPSRAARRGGRVHRVP